MAPPCICMCISMCIRMYVCMYIYTYIRICIYTYTHTHTHTHICINIPIRTIFIAADKGTTRPAGLPVDDIKFPAPGRRPIDAKLPGAVTRGDGIPAKAGDGGPRLVDATPVDGVPSDDGGPRLVDATPVDGVPSDDNDAVGGGGPEGAGGFFRGRFFTAF